MPVDVEVQPPASEPAVRTRSVALDAVCAAAVDVARDAALELAGADGLGEHLGVEAEDDRVATHRFAAKARGYLGWEWSVTVARASRAKNVTVDEVYLLPGAGALLAPPWVPYAERLRPGDLGPGDILPVPPDDDRLEPGWTGGVEALEDDGEPELQVGELAWELGLARNRVLSLTGLDDAADRWLNGPGGPQSALAEAAPGECVSCGFLVRLGGLLGQAFGVCANEHSPSDGHVVTMDHGCGAHSEGGEILSLAAAPPVVLDSMGYDSLGDVVLADVVPADVVEEIDEIDEASEPTDVIDEAGEPADEEPEAGESDDEEPAAPVAVDEPDGSATDDSLGHG